MSAGFREYLEEQFAPIGGVSIRSMFGGLGVFRESLMFGLVADDTLYFRIDDGNLPAYQQEGSEPFVYTGGKGKPMAMAYWRAPERLFDDPEEFERWAKEAFAAAARVDAAKPASKRRRR